MVGKRVQFDDETWEAIEVVARYSGRSFQEVADEALMDFLKKDRQPVGLMDLPRESVRTRSRPRRKRT